MRMVASKPALYPKPGVLITSASRLNSSGTLPAVLGKGSPYLSAVKWGNAVDGRPTLNITKYLWILIYHDAHTQHLTSFFGQVFAKCQSQGFWVQFPWLSLATRNTSLLPCAPSSACRNWAFLHRLMTLDPIRFYWMHLPLAYLNLIFQLAQDFWSEVTLIFDWGPFRGALLMFYPKSWMGKCIVEHSSKPILPLVISNRNAAWVKL